MELSGPDVEGWDRLAVQGRNIFLTPDFVQAWWSVYRPRGVLRVLADDQRDPRFLLPLYSSGGPVPLVRQIGHGPADALGPLCAPSFRDQASHLVRQELGKELRRGVVVLHDAAVDDKCISELGGQVVRRTPGPAVRLGVSTWDDFLATRSKNFREQVRRKHRRLERSFETTVRLSTQDTLEDDLETLFRLHRLRWGATAPFATSKQADLARVFARSALARDRLRLWMMDLDGRPAAALFGLRVGDVHSFWQSGRDPDFEHHSVGSVLLMHSVRAAVEDGAIEYRLLRGDEAYKQRLADLDRSTRTVALGHGWPAAAAIRVARLRRRVQRLSSLAVVGSGRPEPEANTDSRTVASR